MQAQLHLVGPSLGLSSLAWGTGALKLGKGPWLLLPIQTPATPCVGPVPSSNLERRERKLLPAAATPQAAEGSGPQPFSVFCASRYHMLSPTTRNVYRSKLLCGLYVTVVTFVPPSQPLLNRFSY